MKNTITVFNSKVVEVLSLEITIPIEDNINNEQEDIVFNTDSKELIYIAINASLLKPLMSTKQWEKILLGALAKDPSLKDIHKANFINWRFWHIKFSVKNYKLCSKSDAEYFIHNQKDKLFREICSNQDEITIANQAIL